VIRILYRIRRRWWSFRHEVFTQVAQSQPPVKPSRKGNDAANIQYTIDRAAKVTHVKYLIAKRKYDNAWYSFFLKKPVLRQVARIRAGTYNIKSTLQVGPNINIEGVNANKIKAKVKEK
jgi:hypothetical protein